MGHGVQHGHPDVYHTRLTYMLNSSMPASYGKVSVYNGAVAGTLSTFMSACVRNHLPEQVDLVLIEYAVNDLPCHPFDSDQRMGFERLLRKVLNYPKRPAVVLVNTYQWFNVKGEYTGHVEADFMEYGSYYGLPVVSLKAAAHELMDTGVDGFWVNTTRWAAIEDRERWVEGGRLRG